MSLLTQQTLGGSGAQHSTLSTRSSVGFEPNPRKADTDVHTRHISSAVLFTPTTALTHISCHFGHGEKKSHTHGNMYPSLQSSTMVPRHASGKHICLNSNAWVRDPTFSQHQKMRALYLSIPGSSVLLRGRSRAQTWELVAGPITQRHSSRTKFPCLGQISACTPVL